MVVNVYCSITISGKCILINRKLSNEQGCIEGKGKNIKMDVTLVTETDLEGIV